MGRRDRASIARQVVKDKKLLRKTVPLLGKVMAKELKATCSVDSSCMLSNTEPKTLESFTWQKLCAQLETIAPVTTGILAKCITSNRSARALKSPRKSNVDAVVGLCLAILLRARSRNMNLIQRLILSVILYGGYASKQVNFC